MTLAFKLWERVNYNENNDRVNAVVVAGSNLSDDFWESFISLCNNNADGLSEILNVPKDKIGTWGSKIRKILDTQTGNTDDKSSRNVLMRGEENEVNS